MQTINVHLVHPVHQDLTASQATKVAVDRTAFLVSPLSTSRPSTSPSRNASTAHMDRLDHPAPMASEAHEVCLHYSVIDTIIVQQGIRKN
jgi:hypothetical protein